MARFVLASLFAQSVQAFNVGFAPPLARSLRASSVRMADDEFSYTPKTVFMFPGQGAQTVGMGVEVAAEVPAAAELYAKASEILGYDLLAKCKDGPKEELDSTVISQPAIFVASMAAVGSMNFIALLLLSALCSRARAHSVDVGSRRPCERKDEGSFARKCSFLPWPPGHA